MSAILQAVLEVAGRAHLRGPFIDEAAQVVATAEVMRGRPLSTDHAKQIAVKWARENRERMDAYWREFYRQPTQTEWDMAEAERMGRITDEVLRFA